jgi:hypothetical protein
MRICVVLVVLMTVAMPLHAQSADMDVCVTIDEARDMLSAADRSAAIRVMEARFELEGRRVSPACGTIYALSHIRLGETIIVSLLGPKDRRDGTALGLDDLPALYSQMVRSLVTGRPMTGFNVVDRTNVTVSQAAAANRVDSERFTYARLGFGSVFGDHAYGGPAIGFGYRVEGDTLGLDVSFLNFQAPSDDGSGSGATAGSLLKLQGLYFTRPKANAATYFGGGVSWGGTDFGGATYHYSNGVSNGRSSWSGSGLQGELTVGV